MKFPRRLSLTAPVLALLLTGASWTPGLPGPAAMPLAHADEGNADAVDRARATLVGLIGQEAQLLPRAKSVKRLAVLDSKRAMVGLLEGLGIFVEKWSSRRVRAAALYKTFTEQGYDKFTSNGDPRFWDTKKKLTEKVERNDKVLREDAAVARVFVAAISKLTDSEATGHLASSLKTDTNRVSRGIVYEGLLRNPEVDPVALTKRALKDSDPTVRLAALGALATRTLPDLVKIVIPSLKEKGWPHRQAAARALGAFGDVRAVLPLINAMGQEEGRLVEDYADALAKIVTEKLGPNPDSWKAWYEDHKDKLLEMGASKGTVKRPKKIQRKAVSYYGIKTLSKRLVFIIDISGSMKEIIGEEKKGPTTGDKPENYNGPKIEIAKRTLKQAIRGLSTDTYFNIVVYNHGVRRFQETMLKADQDGKNEAYLMINELKPSGATYTYGALKEAFLMAGRGVTDKAYNPGVDTIFLLSDGAPTDSDVDNAKPMEGDKIIKAVDDWNALSRVQIHTIAIDPRVSTGRFIKFMKSLAVKNNGSYTTIPPQK